MTGATLLDRILEPNGIRVVFQPIFDRRHDGWHVYGLEALTRAVVLRSREQGTPGARNRPDARLA